MIRIRRFVDWRTTGGALQILGAVFLLLVVVLTGRPYFTNASKPPSEIGSSLIAFEHAKDVDDVDAILSDAPSPDREVMRIKQYISIALTLVFAGIGIIAARHLMSRFRPAGLIPVVALLVCVFTLLESNSILRLIETPLSRTDAGSLNSLRIWSIGKWAALAATTALFAAFLLLAKSGFGKAVGVVNLLATIILAVGIGQVTILPVGAVAAGVAISLSAVTLKFARYEESTPRTPVSRTV